MDTKRMNLQDAFLNQVRKENTDIEIVLCDGARLRGHVRGFDNFTLILQTSSAQHLIYKHAIAQLVQKSQGHGGGRPNRGRGGASGHKKDAPKNTSKDTPKDAPKAEAAPKSKFNTIDVSELELDAQPKS